jgi:hypothetical protein
MCFALYCWRTFQPCVGTFRVNRFHLYCMGPKQNKHTSYNMGRIMENGFPSRQMWNPVSLEIRIQSVLTTPSMAIHSTHYRKPNNFFELIDFIFIVWVPSRTSIHQVMVQLEIYRLGPLRRLNKFQCRKPNILLTFMQTLAVLKTGIEMLYLSWCIK